MNRVQLATQLLRCPKCGMGPGARCRTKSGKSYGGKWFAHQARVQPFEDEWRRGWAAAEQWYELRRRKAK